MKKKELERRAYNFEVRAEEDEKGKIITGRPIVYNSRTDLGFFDEIIEGGALDNAEQDGHEQKCIGQRDRPAEALSRSYKNCKALYADIQSGEIPVGVHRCSEGTGGSHGDSGCPADRRRKARKGKTPKHGG